MSEDSPHYGKPMKKPPLEEFRDGDAKMGAFLSEELDAFEAHLKREGLKRGAWAERLRGAEQFADWLRGVPHRKGQATARKSGTLGG